MVLIREVAVSPETEEHIWTKHHVTLEEVEEVCLARPWILRNREGGYAVYGQTAAGRYLVAFLYPRGRGVYSMATARPMDDAERRRYQESRGR